MARLASRRVSVSARIAAAHYVQIDLRYQPRGPNTAGSGRGLNCTTESAHHLGRQHAGRSQIAASMSFDALAARALDTASKRGAQYADVRFETNRSERIEARNGIVATLSDSTSRGYGIRALVDGAWGFAAASDLSDAGRRPYGRARRGDRKSRCIDRSRYRRASACARLSSTGSQPG